jgi:hypothetical protein
MKTYKNSQNHPNYQKTQKSDTKNTKNHQNPAEITGNDKDYAPGPAQKAIAAPFADGGGRERIEPCLLVLPGSKRIAFKGN